MLERITIRRTRSNIANEPDCAADLAAQGVSFPRVVPPNELVYYLDDKLDALFWNTLEQLQTRIAYARYRAVEFLVDPEDATRYGNAVHVAQTLAGVYKTHMVKRLESSFYAFKRSVAFLRITNDMLAMLDKDKVLIIPDLDVTDYLEKGKSLDEILDYAGERGLDNASFPASAFRAEFRDLLEKDRDVLAKMQDDWSRIDYDPKFDAFRSVLRGEIFGKALNPTGKLVVFSESVDTLVHLRDRMTEALGRSDILLVTADTRDRAERDIRRSFDANAAERTDDYNTILASDVLAEGINLHRANVIVNYDTPWNATRLMQRIGRVNRIGSVADKIYNYMFHPSKQGNAAIGLYQNSVVKLQGFHSALGEDAKVFSNEEMLRTFTLFDANIKDAVDEQLRYLR
nr:SWF/SNF helicase family protein [Schwartzia sp. (in: firmicutes)]